MSTLAPGTPEAFSASDTCASCARDVVPAYLRGDASGRLPADLFHARSILGPGTAEARSFADLAPELPVFDPDRCVACMECVTFCPDTAILGKVLAESTLDAVFSHAGPDDDAEAARLRVPWIAAKKYVQSAADRGLAAPRFTISVDVDKCKGCGECVDVCGDRKALAMQAKSPALVEATRASHRLFEAAGPSDDQYLVERSLADLMLSTESLLYTGGAGSCMGCGEATAIRMMLAATGFTYGADSIGIVASTGCNSVFGATFPWNPYRVAWTNSLFENAPAVAMGIRRRWDQLDHARRRLWVIGGDGAMLDIGFQSLSRMLMSGMDIKVLVLDTQVYSNTGGQSSTASFLGQEAKMSSFGKERHGKSENRKELGLIAMMHGNVYVAQTTAAHFNHFYRAIRAANEFNGPAVVNVFATCQPEHGVADDASARQERLAVASRAFPLFEYDPRRGKSFAERLSLRGNPAVGADWWTNPKTGESVDFITWARTEGRFRHHFAADGAPSPELVAGRDERLDNWRRLRELAG